MALASSIVLADAQATPVNHTFVPLGRDPSKPGIFWFEDQIATVTPLLWNRIGLELVRDRSAITPGAKSADRTTRIKFSVHVPVGETLGTNDSGIVPSATVAFVPRFVGEFIYSDRASQLNRKDVRKYVAGLLGNAQLVSMVEDFVNLQ